MMRAQEIELLVEAALSAFLSLEAGEQIVSAKQITQSYYGKLLVFPGAVAEIAGALKVIIRGMETKDPGMVVHPLNEYGLSRAVNPVTNEDEARACLPWGGGSKYAGIRIVVDPNDVLFVTWRKMCGAPGAAGVQKTILSALKANNNQKLSDESVKQIAKALLKSPEGLTELIKRVTNADANDLLELPLEE